MSAFLVALGGVATMILWLKATSLLGVADRPKAETTWSTVLPGLILGGFIGVVAFILWSRLVPRLVRDTTVERARLAWAFSDFPLALYAAVLIPLDLLIVGPEIVSSSRQDGTFAMIWGAFSFALLLAATAWSVYLFVRGSEAAAGQRSGRPYLPMVVSAFVLLSLFYVPLVVIKELIE